jgi:hypothetical protein
MLHKLNDMNYLDFVEGFAREGKNQVFFNSGPIHAAIVMSRIFKYSKDTVKIYCGGFSGTVSNDERYLKNLQNFLENGGQLKILAERDLSNAGKSKIFPLLRKHSSSVEMYRAQLHVRNIDINKPVHFTIGDNRMIRLETGTDDYTAEVNFGDVDKAKRLSDLFTEVWNASQGNRISLSA